LVILSGNEEEQKQPTSVVQESTPKIKLSGLDCATSTMGSDYRSAETKETFGGIVTNAYFYFRSLKAH